MRAIEIKCRAELKDKKQLTVHNEVNAKKRQYKLSKYCFRGDLAALYSKRSFQKKSTIG